MAHNTPPLALSALALLLLLLSCFSDALAFSGPLPDAPTSKQDLLSAIHEFDQWTRSPTPRDASPQESSRYEEVGTRLAQRRLVALRALMHEDPKLALQKSLSFESRQALPSFLHSADLLEHTVSGIGSIAQIEAICHDASECSPEDQHKVSALIDGKLFDAFVSESTLNSLPLLNKPLFGMAIENEIAIDEKPIRPISGAEFEARRSEWRGEFSEGNDALTGEPLVNGIEDQFLGEVGGVVFRFNTMNNMESFVPPESISELFPVQENERGFSYKAVQKTGQLSILIIRVDYSDLAGDPKAVSTGTAATTQQFQAVFGSNGEIDVFMKQNSNNKLSVGPVTITPTLRMPKTAAFYKNGQQQQLLLDAYDAAVARGYNPDSYGNFMVMTTKIFSFAGASFVGFKGMWCNGYPDLRSMGHELGHSIGAQHANFLHPTTGVVIAYGNNMDIMGCCSSYPNRHFNTRVKNLFGWIPSSDVISVTASGTFTINAHDFVDSSGKRAIKITIPNVANEFYWLEHRQAESPTYLNRDSVVLHKTFSTYTSAQGSWLLDATPSTNNCGCSTSSGCTSCNVADTPLVVGKGWSDTKNKVHINAKALSGTRGTSSSKIEVQIIIGTNMCWSHGTFNSATATCQCNSGWKGVDCSQAASPPESN